MKIPATLLVYAFCAWSVVGYAQIVPGYRAPTDLVDAAALAVTGGCYLASAGRPVPGINMPAGGLAGEGVKERRSAPKWVEKASSGAGRSKYSTLGSPEGDIWIRVDEATKRCSVIVRTSDVAKFRSALGDSLVKGSSESKRETAADGSESIVKSAPTFAWTSRISSPVEMPDVVVIETFFTQK